MLADKHLAFRAGLKILEFWLVKTLQTVSDIALSQPSLLQCHRGVTTSRARYAAIVKGHTLLKITHTHENDARKQQNMVNTVWLNFQLCFLGRHPKLSNSRPSGKRSPDFRRHQSSDYTMMFLRQRTNQVHEMIVCQKWPDSSQMEYVEKYTQRGFWSEGSFFASKNQQPRNTQDSTQKSCVLHRASCGASKKVGGSCPFHRNIWKDASTSYDPDASKSGSYLCS